MNLYFANARYPAGRFHGQRIHIESRIRHLIRAGCRVWLPPDSAVGEGTRLSAVRPLREMQLSRMDALYLRIDGLDRFPRGLEALPVILEVNATPELWAAERPDEAAAHDEALRRMAPRVRAVLCNTDGLAAYARDLGLPNVFTVELGSEPELFASAVPDPAIEPNPEGLNVIWCGSHSIRWHDMELVFESMRRLAGENIRFYFASYNEIALGDAENGRLLGGIPHERMPGILAAMDVGLAIYKDPAWSRYGNYTSPLKFFEYCAAGLAVVASPIDQIRKCIKDGENGFLVPFGDANALAAKLLELRNNKAGLAPVRDRARRLVADHYNWERVARESCAVIRRHAGVRGAAPFRDFRSSRRPAARFLPLPPAAALAPTAGAKALD